MPNYRMIHVDHYMCKPVAPFDDLRSEISGKPTAKVPVIRIFGADADGRKICIHVHGFYPYIAIQNREPDNKDLITRIVSDIEKSLIKLVEENRNRHNQNEPRARQPAPGPATTGPSDIIEQDADSNLGARIQQERTPLTYLGPDQKSPIHRVERIKSFNYYGYHSQLEDFFKLHLYNPRMIKPLAQLFEDCRVLNRFIPVFWAHLPYILLFFIDNNLRGMQFLEVDQIYWRKNKMPAQSSISPFSPNGHIVEPRNSNHVSENEESDFITDIEPISSCELEGDIRFEWILNKRKFGSKTNDDALKELWLDDQEITQATSLIDPKLPLYSLERNYIEQLCESYGIDCKALDLELDELEEVKGVDTQLNEDEDDEFSDDDQYLMQAMIKAETQDTTLKLQSSMKPECKPTPESNQKVKRRFSDNSMIDGRSVICSTTKESSQHSSSSTRESISHEYQYLCLMSMELHCSTRNKLRPDPAFDPIEAVFYCVRNDAPETSSKSSQIIGMIITDPFGDETNNVGKSFPGFPSRSPRTPTSSNQVMSPGTRSNMSFAQKIRSLLHKTGLSMKDIELIIVDTEMELIMNLVDVVRSNDPEILLGYEMEQLSWGYLLERASFLNMNISSGLSRVSDSNISHNSKIVESNFVQPIMFTGRMVFSTWRIIRHEINLNTCSFERIHHHTLGERIPCYSFETLTQWFNEHRNRWRVIDYYLIRVVGQMRILDRFDLMAKVSELARVYGTQFIDVITRGSQIGIESMMLRLAKLENLTPLSPTVMQRNKMRAPEALPLVMEPETDIYYDPVAVLDFQSLYPSVVIAYNYCYSTCLGRILDLESKQRFNFGCSQLELSEAELGRLLESNGIHVSPCGVGFVKKSVRRGILPKMLSELIVTRAMVKDQMKKNMKSSRPNRRLQKILDHRQHGLKMMANTTFGYTGASYTGRMPCVEIADSIVSKGRETLEKAIELVESRAEWGAKVIYGDTDSMFIQFRGCEREVAFKRAFEMVEAITAQNPYPIKMKFEKIYQPCVLQTKKRYCGFKFESPDQTRPEFEAKGIETVRRDCCPAAARMLEMALRIQFTTRDVNEVRRYVQQQFVKIMAGKLSNIQDFIFARQYKPRAFDKTESVFVPAWQISKRLLATDPRSEPRLNERVPFVIIYGEPKTPLVNLAKTPLEVLENLSYRINADYYIQKIICPTLNRIFCTLKVDTLLWYKSMPHQNLIQRSHHLMAQRNERPGVGGSITTMSQYFSPSNCPVCARSIPVGEEVCDSCRLELQSSVVRLTEEISRNQRKLFAHHQICRACSSLERSEASRDEHYNPCISYDCENLFRYHQAKLDALNSSFLAQVLKSLC